MHEHTLLRGLMRKLESLVTENGGGRAATVTVSLGALSHITPEHFREHFAEASRGTVAEGACLQVVVHTDPAHPLAQEIVLESVEVEE